MTTTDAGIEVIKYFACSTQLSMKFQLLIKVKTLKIMIFLAVKLIVGVLILQIYVKMPTIVCILTYNHEFFKKGLND